MIRVAVGIVYNSENEILIAKRLLDKHLGGYWEFPGGKIEADESTFAALKREFKEEVNIELISANPLTEIEFTYPEKQVRLDVWKIDKYQGIAQGLEGQELRWVQLQDLESYSFPEANKSIFVHL